MRIACPPTLSRVALEMKCSSMQACQRGHNKGIHSTQPDILMSPGAGEQSRARESVQRGALHAGWAYATVTSRAFRTRGPSLPGVMLPGGAPALSRAMQR